MYFIPTWVCLYYFKSEELFSKEKVALAVFDSFFFGICFDLFLFLYHLGKKTYKSNYFFNIIYRPVLYQSCTPTVFFFFLGFFPSFPFYTWERLSKARNYWIIHVANGWAFSFCTPLFSRHPIGYTKLPFLVLYFNPTSFLLNNIFRVFSYLYLIQVLLRFLCLVYDCCVYMCIYIDRRDTVYI